MVARLAAFAAALALAGCADQPRPDRFAGGPPHDRRGPPPGGTGPPGMGRARLFISPMGEPFRGEDGGIAPAAAWFAAADADHDGKLTRAEFSADAMRFFATLDVDRNGEIGPSEIDRYEQVVAPEIVIGGEGGFGGGERPGGGRGRHGGRGGAPGGGGGGGGGPPGGGGGPPGEGGGGRGRGGSFGGGALGGPGAGEPLQGAGRFGYLAAPEPVIAADADLNRAVTRAEFEAAAQRRFALLDRDGNGVLTEAELPRLGGGRPRSAP